MSDEKKSLVLKRPHEDDNNVCNSLAPLDDSDGTQNKKLKGFGVPNWKNIKHSSTAIRRYKDYEILKTYNYCRDLIRDREKRLLSMPIHTISINVLCKHKKDASFIPLEIGMFTYKLGKGRSKEPYHVLINAGNLPVGHLSLATEHAKHHKITFPPKDKGYPETARCDYKIIYKEMLDYVKEGERTILIPHIRDMNQIVKSLEWLWDKAAEEGARLPKVSTWTIIPVKEYLLAMHHWVEIEMLKSIKPSFCVNYYLNMLYEADKYQYDDNIRCDYHRIEGYETEWCALSVATRMITNAEKLVDEIFQKYKHATKPLPLLPPQQLAIQGPESNTPRENANQQENPSKNLVQQSGDEPLPIAN